jgi:hypothetical protein
MKNLLSKTNQLFSFSLVSVLVMLAVSCSTPAEKVENAEVKVALAEDQLNTAEKEFNEDVKQFRAETEKSIISNEVMIEDLKGKIKTSNVKNRAENEKKIAHLEQKNKDLRLKIDGYKGENNNDWMFFKSELKKDMDTLGSALKNFFTDNK